jgi:2-polyprenyl-3-methyl-5-hydroxy-6-metoxy-1,4-benzoquinol methylase
MDHTPAAGADGAAQHDSSLKAARVTAYENPRPAIQRRVSADTRRVLDLGCSSGAVGAAIRSRTGAEVVGVELDEHYAQRARERLNRVIVADIEELAGRPELAAELGEFDCLIAGDVLEHTRDPWTCLRHYASLLAPGGTAIVSLPNVRFWETFWQLGWRGDWPRRSEGIFDRDHLRWFTVRTGLELVEQAGLCPVAVDPYHRIRPNSSRGDRIAALLGHTPLRAFFIFQFLIVARR